MNRPDRVSIDAVGDESADVLALAHRDCFDTAWTAETFRQMLSIPGTMALVALADVDGRADMPDVAGFIVVRAVSEDAEILTVGVRPHHRRGGIGRRLLNRVFELMRQAGATSMLLEVAQDNRSALSLYRRCGFTEVGRRPNYYRKETQEQASNRPMARDALLLRAAIVEETT